MPYKIYKGEFDIPIMRIMWGPRAIEFALAGFPADNHEWLGEVLDKQIQDLVEHAQRIAIQSQQQQMRKLLGLD